MRVPSPRRCRLPPAAGEPAPVRGGPDRAGLTPGAGRRRRQGADRMGRDPSAVPQRRVPPRLPRAPRPTGSYQSAPPIGGIERRALSGAGRDCRVEPARAGKGALRRSNPRRARAPGPGPVRGGRHGRRRAPAAVAGSLVPDRLAGASACQTRMVPETTRLSAGRTPPLALRPRRLPRRPLPRIRPNGLPQGLRPPAIAGSRHRPASRGRRSNLGGSNPRGRARRGSGSRPGRGPP